MKLVIIGNGIIALSTAFRAAKRMRPQDEIIIIGKASRPGSATKAAAAMLASFGEVEEGSLDSPLDEFRFELSRLSAQIWPKFVDDIMEVAGSRLPQACAQCEGTCGGCFELGTYLINNTASDNLDDCNFKAIVEALKKYEEPYQS